MLVSFTRHPFGSREMAIEGTAGALDIVIRVYVQHDPRNLAPVRTFLIGIQHTHIRDGVLLMRGNLGGLVQLGGYCRRSALPLINLAYLLSRHRLLYQSFIQEKLARAIRS